MNRIFAAATHALSLGMGTAPAFAFASDIDACRLDTSLIDEIYHTAKSGSEMNKRVARFIEIGQQLAQIGMHHEMIAQHLCGRPGDRQHSLL